MDLNGVERLGVSTRNFERDEFVCQYRPSRKDAKIPSTKMSRTV